MRKSNSYGSRGNTDFRIKISIETAKRKQPSSSPNEKDKDTVRQSKKHSGEQEKMS